MHHRFAPELSPRPPGWENRVVPGERQTGARSPDPPAVRAFAPARFIFSHRYFRVKSSIPVFGSMCRPCHLPARLRPPRRDADSPPAPRSP